MARKKLAKKLEEMQRAEEAYEKINVVLRLSEMKTVDEKVRACVFAANEVLAEICTNADKIKIDMWEKANDIVEISKPQWKDFAHLAYQLSNGTIKDNFFEKNEEKLHESLYVLNMRKSFYDTYVKECGEAKFVHKDAVPDLEDMDDRYTSEEFERILLDAVQVRTYLNKVLWPSFREFQLAAFYVTKGELDSKSFKDLVDWEHYKEGGYPNEKSKPWLWAIFDRFDRAYRLMDKYKFPQLQELVRQFGMNVEMKEPAASRNSYSASGRLFAKYEVVRPICLDSQSEMKMLNDELGIFLSPNHFAIFDKSTRVIRRIIEYPQYLAEIGNPTHKIFTSKGIKDNWDYLVLDDVSYPLYRKLIEEIGALELIHPDGQDKPNHSLRVLTHNELELLGEQGYYGNGQNPSESQIPRNYESSEMDIEETGK